jgi:hypothetical protein
VLEIAARRPEIGELVGNEWVRLVVVDPDDGSTWIYRGTASGSFERWITDGIEVPIVSRSQDWYRGKTDHLKPARVVSRAESVPIDPRLTLREVDAHEP